MHGVIVNLLDGFAFGVGAVTRWRVWHVGCALPGADYVIGVEICAVVELDAFAQFEFPGQLVNRLPGYSQTRCQALALVLFDQAIKDMHRHRIVWPKIVEMRVQRRWFRGQSDCQALGGCRGRHPSGQGNSAVKSCFALHVSLPVDFRHPLLNGPVHLAVNCAEDRWPLSYRNKNSYTFWL